MVGWVSGCVRACVSASVRLSRFSLHVVHTTVFARSLLNFSCTLFMMRGGTLLILGHGVKGQGQLWHSVNKTLWVRYRLLFLLNHFQTSHAHCSWWEEEPYWFWVTGSKVKVNFGTLCIKPYGHDTDYSFCPITFKLHMHIVHDGRRNRIDFGSWGQRSKSTLTLCWIKPCGHDTDYSFCPITFKLLMHIVDDDRKNLGRGVKGQGQL